MRLRSKFASCLVLWIHFGILNATCLVARSSEPYKLTEVEMAARHQFTPKIWESRGIKGKTDARARAMEPIDDGVNVQCQGTDDSIALTAAITTAKGRSIIIAQGQTCSVNDVTIPNLRVEAGGLLRPVTGHIVTLSGRFDAGMYQVFANALSGQGTVLFAPTASVKEIYPQWWGAKGDGTSDDTHPLNAALAQKDQNVYIPKGMYKTTATLTVPTCAAIIGSGRNSTSFVPSVAVKTWVKVDSHTNRMEGFDVNGTATTNATGIIFGDATNFTPWNGAVDMIRVRFFTGTSGVGIRIADTQKASFTHIIVERNEINLLIQKITGAYPTTTSFRNSHFTDATTKGVKIVDGNSIDFNACVFESNGEEGAIITGTNDALDVMFHDNCYFAGNYEKDRTRFQFAANSSSGTVRPVIKDCLFLGNAKSIHFSGPGLRGYLLENVQTPEVTGTILIENGSFGNIIASPPTNLVAETVTDLTGLGSWFRRGQVRFPVTPVPSTDVNTLDDYREGRFTPTLVLAGGSITYTKQTGSYTKIGRLVTVQILITVRAANTPSGNVTIGGLPFAASNEAQGAVSVLADGLVNLTAIGLMADVEAGKSAIRLFKFSDGALVPLGASAIRSGTTFRITATYEVNN